MNNDNGENLETPTASPAEIITPEPKDPVNHQGADTEGPEEVAFNALKGGTQDRIKAILNERDEFKAQVESRDEFIRTQRLNQPVAEKTDLSDPKVKAAVQQLSDVGIATKDEVDTLVNQRIGNLVYNFELEKLETRLDGTNGQPKFDRAEYRDYITRNPKYQGYDPEDVYNKMYAGEIEDAKQKTPGNQTPNNSLRPNKTQVREEQWSPESVEARMKEADGKNWYVANKDLVNKVLSTQEPKPQ